MFTTKKRRSLVGLAGALLISGLMALAGCSAPVTLQSPADTAVMAEGERAAGDFVLYFKYTGTGTPQAYAWLPNSSNQELFGSWSSTAVMTAVSGQTGWWSADVSAKGVASGTKVGVIFKLADGTKLSGAQDQFRTATGWCRMESNVPVWYTSNPENTVAAAPTITPNVAGVDTNTDIILATTTNDAFIYYTTNGTTPTTSSTKYTSSFKLPVGSITVKAMAVIPGSPASAVTSKTYTVTQGATNAITVYTKNYNKVYYWSPVPAGSVGATSWPGVTLNADPSGWSTYTFTGATSINLIFSTNGTGQTPDMSRTTGSWWYKNGSWTDYDPDTPPTIVATPSIMPKTDTLTTNDTVTISTATTGATIYYTIDGTNPTTASPVYSAGFKLTAGTKTVKALAVKSGLTNSTIAAQTYVVSTPPPAGITVHAKGYTHIYYWSAVPAGSPANATWPGVAMTNDAAGWPTYTFPNATSINIIFSNAGSGQTPDLSRTTGEWWYKAGVWTNSNPEAAVIPVISTTPSPGKFTTTQSVKLAGSNADDKIYYTTNGTTPTTASTLYNGTAISVSTPTTIKAFGVNRDGGQGAVGSFLFDVSSTYDLTAPTMTSSVPQGQYTTAQLVSFTFNDNKGGITAYYTTDGTEPTTATTTKVTTTGTSVSTASFNVSTRTIFNFLVIDSAGNVMTATYSYNIGAYGRSDFRSETIYFVITPRFYDGDTSNNTHNWDDAVAKNPDSDPAWRGDFKGLIQKLDYIKALGFSAVWITPVVENMSGYDYHGYHAVNFKKVDPRYLSSDTGYQELINAAHAKGMKIIQDIVVNHTSNFGEENLYPMFKKDWTAIKAAGMLNGDTVSKLVKIAPAGRLPANYDTLTGAAQYGARIDAMKNDAIDTAGIYHHEKSLSWESYTVQTGQIAGDCVDLNTENPTVYKYLTDAYNQYIDMGVDGFRVDTVKHVSRLTFNNTFIPAWKQRGGDNFYIFGEICTRYRQVWNSGIPAISAPFYTWKERTGYAWSATDRLVNEASVLANWNDNTNTGNQPTSLNTFLNGNAYRPVDYSMRSGFDVIDFPMHWNFANARDAFGVAIGNDQVYNDATWNVTYIDSHDYAPDTAPENQRFALGQDVWAENLSLIFTFRGIPTLYYGSEIEFKKGAMIDVGPNAPLSTTGRAYFGDYISGSVTAQTFGKYTGATGTTATTLAHPLATHIRQLNLIRHAIPALQKGQYTTADISSGGMAYKRRYTDSTTDSFALVTVSGDATFNNIPNGTYVDAVTGDTKTVTGGSLSTSGAGNKGNLRVYVLSTAKTPAPGKVTDTFGTYIK